MYTTRWLSVIAAISLGVIACGDELSEHEAADPDAEERRFEPQPSDAGESPDGAQSPSATSPTQTRPMETQPTPTPMPTPTAPGRSASESEATPPDVGRGPPGESQSPSAPTGEDVARANAPAAALQAVTTDWSGGDPAQGEELYSLYCVTCHGPEGRGDGRGADALNPKPRDFTGGEFYVDATANGETGEPADLARIISQGPAAFGGSPAMPAWGGVFTEDDVRNLVAYVQSLAEQGSGAQPETPREQPRS